MNDPRSSNKKRERKRYLEVSSTIKKPKEKFQRKSEEGENVPSREQIPKGHSPFKRGKAPHGRTSKASIKTVEKKNDFLISSLSTDTDLQKR